MDIESIDKHLTNATFGEAPANEAPESIARPPLSEAQIKDNLRRLKYPCFVTVHPDGTRSYKHDPGVQRDVLISTVGADRGEGSRDSIKMLREEDANVVVDGLLLRDASDGRARDERGRFVAREW